MTEYDAESARVNFETAIAAAEAAVQQWDGWDVSTLLHPLQRVQDAATELDYLDDHTVVLLELLEERATWPKMFEEQQCPFALVADPCGRFISWDFPHNQSWLRSKRLTLGCFPAEATEHSTVALNVEKLRSAVGIPREALGEFLGADSVTVDRWEADSDERADAQPVPKYVLSFLLAWKRLTAEQREAVARDLATIDV